MWKVFKTLTVKTISSDNIEICLLPAGSKGNRRSEIQLDISYTQALTATWKYHKSATLKCKCP